MNERMKPLNIYTLEESKTYRKQEGQNEIQPHGKDSHTKTKDERLNERQAARQKDGTQKANSK